MLTCMDSPSWQTMLLSTLKKSTPSRQLFSMHDALWCSAAVAATAPAVAVGKVNVVAAAPS